MVASIREYSLWRCMVRKSTVIATTLLTFACQPGFTWNADQELHLKQAMVKVFVTYKKPSYYQPWQMNAQNTRAGSGCIVNENRILTNAHVVSDGTYIQVLRAGEVQKYTARVEFVAHDSDLALLTVKDDRFFQGTTAVEFGEMPFLRDKVAVYGFPMGGTKLSITEGVVSRIEVMDYSHSSQSLMAMQIDAAINPGNSGGPVILDDRIVGVAFQSYRQGENIGYAVPLPIINRFFTDIEDGKYDGVPIIGIYMQDLENPSMRSWLKMKEEQTGVYIRKVLFDTSAWRQIHDDDVLLAINGITIANDLTIKYREDERIELNHILSRYQIGDKVTVTLLRNGEKITRELTLKGVRYLIPRARYDVKPTFFIFAGLVFTPATRDYMNSWNKWDNVPTRLKYHYYYGFAEEEQHEVVLISKVLAHDVNQGYQDVGSSLVTMVNGQEISTIRDVIAALEYNRDKYHTIVMDDSFVIALDAATAKEAHPEILSLYGIKEDRSDDLK